MHKIVNYLLHYAGIMQKIISVFRFYRIPKNDQGRPKLFHPVAQVFVSPPTWPTKLKLKLIFLTKPPVFCDNGVYFKLFYNLF